MLYSTAVILVASALSAVFAVFLQAEHVYYSVQHFYINELTLTDAIFPKALLVDARSWDDYAKEHIPGALSLDQQDWDTGLVSFLEHWTPSRPVVIYCGGQACGLSKAVALRLLTDLPEADVYVLKQGFSAWKLHQAKLKPTSQ